MANNTNNYGGGYNTYVRGSEAPAIEVERAPRRRSRIPISPRKRAARANRRSLALFGVVTAITAAAIALGVNYLNLRSDLITTTSEINTLQEELNTLTTNNDEKQVDVESNINYQEIYDKAVNEYGMTYPDANNIVEYDGGTLGYIRQYENIPNN